MTAELGAHLSSHAVLIGVSAYEHAGFPPIRAARNSLDAMRDLLCDPTLCGWPPEHVTIIANPLSAADLAGQVADVAEATTGTLLFYYVGHGALTPAGELCLTVTSTRPDRPKITGLHWSTLADLFRTSPARVRIAILDCCFAGQAIEALTGDDGPGLADITHVQGVYTLTATTRNHTAHVPPPDQQETACTSFTGELRDLLHAGVPGGSARLSFSDIYPVLRERLRAKGLPLPNQRGTDTAGLFPFAANRAAGNGSTAGTRAPRPGADSVPKDRITRLLDDAIRTAGAAERFRRVEELPRLATAVAAVDPERVQSLARLVPDRDGRKAEVLAALAAAVVGVDPDRARHLAAEAERVARATSGADAQASALAGVAAAAATVDPEHAQELAAEAVRLIRSDVFGLTWVAVAAAVAAVDPDRGERLALSLQDPERQWALRHVVEAMAAAHPGRAERLARSITDGYCEKVEALAAVAAANPGRAETLLDDAVRAARPVRDARLRVRAEAAITRAAAGSAASLAATDPDRAERLARSLPGEGRQAEALAAVAATVAATDPDRARLLIAEAERLAESTTGEREYAPALAAIATAVATVDPDRAQRLAESIDDGYLKAAVLAAVARCLDERPSPAPADS